MEAFFAWLAASLTLFLLTDRPETAPPPRETVILLPDDAGGSPGIVVKSMGQEIAITEPYHGVESVGGRIATKQFTADEIRRRFPDVMQVLPAKPRSFTLRFESSDATLTADSAAMLEAIPREIARRAAPEITVVGHTDRVGSEEDNLRLSLSRAQAVRDILVNEGVAAEIIQVVGRGELEPEVETPDGVAEPRNRRVVITVR
jgi:outer membrane protein OmpA-like peptidoglycan-associated protein